MESPVHGCDALELDAVDADFDQILPMAVLPLRVVLAALLLEHDDLLAAVLAEDRGYDRGAHDVRLTDLGIIATDHQNVAEGDLFLIGTAEHVTLELKAIPFGHSILLSTGLDDGVHDNPPKKRC